MPEFTWRQRGSDTNNRLELRAFLAESLMGNQRVSEQRKYRSWRTAQGHWPVHPALAWMIVRQQCCEHRFCADTVRNTYRYRGLTVKAQYRCMPWLRDR